jgi:NAD(P)-dependent dehydrogenase (short-subunit alcohol dehydrogenase family)
MATRVALVTGAAQGIGRAIALILAKDGFNIAIDDVPSKSGELQSVSQEIESLGRQALILTADVSKEESVKEMVDQAVARLGRLDVVRIPSFRITGQS